MQQPNYILHLLCSCADDQLGQDAIEWAVVCGHLQLTWNFEQDRSLIRLQFLEILEGYQRTCSDNCAALIDSYEQVFTQIEV